MPSSSEVNGPKRNFDMVTAYWSDVKLTFLNRSMSFAASSLVACHKRCSFLYQAMRGCGTPEAPHCNSTHGHEQTMYKHMMHCILI
uniref:C3H1-type domain-containing protein n=1 Tax=Romanomermis culicivorax TaxID=13658 RepID=A0A915L5I6_ROMCU